MPCRNFAELLPSFDTSSVYHSERSTVLFQLDNIGPDVDAPILDLSWGNHSAKPFCHHTENPGGLDLAPRAASK